MTGLLPTPPGTPQSTKLSGPGPVSSSESESEADELKEETPSPTLPDSLDELLRSYLELLDLYTRLRKELSDALSSGFLSLAQANFQNRTPGMRFDSTCYDSRMKAIRRTEIGECGRPSDLSGLAQKKHNPRGSEIRIVGELPLVAGARQKPKLDAVQTHSTPASPNEDASGSPQPEKKPKTPSNSVVAQSNGHTDQLATIMKDVTISEKANSSRNGDGQKADCPADGDEKDGPLPASPEKQKPPNLNPLRWFGTFTPSALGQSQRSFSAAVTEIMPKVIATQRAMAEMETKISTARLQSKPGRKAESRAYT